MRLYLVQIALQALGAPQTPAAATPAPRGGGHTVLCEVVDRGGGRGRGGHKHAVAHLHLDGAIAEGAAGATALPAKLLS